MSNNELLDDPKPSQKTGDTNILTVIIPLISIMFVGAVFKIMHWPGYSLFILTSTGALSAYMVTLVAFGKKSLFNVVVLLLNMLVLAYFLWGYFFNGGNPFNEKGLFIYGGVFLVVLLALLFNQWLKKRG